MFHSAAFLWRGLVWLLCAPSGTGKTTQLRHWMNLFGDEISVVSGDKPVLVREPDERLVIWHSPWNGKEAIPGAGSGRLGGLIFLEQADHNEMVEADKKKMVIPLFDEFLFYAESKADIRAVGELEDCLLRNYPVWTLKNLGDEASAILTHDRLESFLAEAAGISEGG